MMGRTVAIRTNDTLAGTPARSPEPVNMLSRRQFLAAAGGLVAFNDLTLNAVERLMRRAEPNPLLAAEDEEFWRGIQQAFTLDRNLVNLNNGGCSPSPRIVHEALKRQLDWSNQAPSYYMWRQLEPEIEAVRSRLARVFGCDTEEIAITRNASEALETCLFGFDLKPGDEILTTNMDYPRMITTIRQREKRDGIKMVQAKMPHVPQSAGELVHRMEAAITTRTRLMLFCHTVFLNGQIYPVAELCAMGKKRGIPVVVDGAHAFAQFAFKQPQLGCEFYGVSLHKWLMAPIGTGFLYVRKERIPDLWPLMAADPETQRADIRKFEEIGTHPAATHNAIGEALTFHEMLGAERKEARLRYLRTLWTEKLRDQKNIVFHTNLQRHMSCGLTTVEIKGIEPDKLATWLHDKRGIFVTSISHEDFKGIRVTPNVYTLASEVDRFAEAMLEVAREGIPATPVQ